MISSFANFFSNFFLQLSTERRGRNCDKIHMNDIIVYQFSSFNLILILHSAFKTEATKDIFNMP